MRLLQQLLYIVILLLVIATYASMVVQMVLKQYQPSFFSRGIWLLLGINSFAGVALGGGSTSSSILAGTTMIGSGICCLASYKYGSRAFGRIEQLSLVLVVISAGLWLLFDAPFVSLILSLATHFIGGIPTIARAVRRPSSEQALHWYFFVAASILAIASSPHKTVRAILYPAYFVCFDGLILTLVNRPRLRKLL